MLPLSERLVNACHHSGFAVTTNAMGHSPSEFNPDPEFLSWFAPAVVKMAKAYNGYEVHGFDHIPPSGGALLVFYHGLVPLDFWYFGLYFHVRTGRMACALVDRFLLKTPGLAWVTRQVGGVVGERRTALELLKSGTVVGVSPGGVREAISGSDKHYQVLWGQRKGFAELAIEAGVPIVPGFTENVEELYRAPLAGSPLLQQIYEKTRLPIVPIFGLGALPFPVKLRTHLGPALYPQPDESPEALKGRVKEALEKLIQAHQTQKQTILGALRDRFLG